MNDLKNIGIRQFLAWRGILPKYERKRLRHVSFTLAGRTHAEFQSGLRAKSLVRLRLREGGTLLTLMMRLERCDSREAVRRLQNGEKGTPVPFLFHRVLASVQLPEVPCRSCVRPPFPRSASSPTLRPASGIGRLSRLARHRPAGRRGILPRGPLRGKRPRLFRRRVPQRCRRVGAPPERFKGGSSPKHITTIDNRSDTVIAFEGFMDFLAYLSLKYPERLRIDAAVLNSVVNLPKAVPFLSRHPVIHIFFDNDEAGRKATADLIRLCPRSEVIDQSHFTAGTRT